MREVAASDSSVIVERATAFGRNAYRVVVPPVHSVTLALHWPMSRSPTVYAWTESAMIAHNRRAAIFPVWWRSCSPQRPHSQRARAAWYRNPFAVGAALFLGAVLLGDLAATGVFDRSWFTDPGGPFAFAFTLGAGAGREHSLRGFRGSVRGPYRKGSGVSTIPRCAVAVLLLGAAAFVNVPGAGLAVRVLTVLGAALSAGYLAHYGRMGVATARRLAPAATIFALVTAATFHALGLFPASLVAPAAIDGFSAAGAMLVALACAVAAIEPAVVRLKALRDHR